MNFLIEQFGKRPDFKEIFDVISRLVTDIEQLQKQGEGNTVGTRCKEILNEMLPSLLNKYISAQAMSLAFSSEKEQSQNKKELSDALEKLQKEVNGLKAESIAFTMPREMNETQKNTFVEFMPQMQNVSVQALDFVQKNVFEKQPQINTEVKKQYEEKKLTASFLIGSAIVMSVFMSGLYLAITHFHPLQYGEPVIETKISQTPSILTMADTPDYKAPDYATTWAANHAPLTAKPEDKSNYLAQKSLYEVELIKSYMHSSYGINNNNYSNYYQALEQANRQETHDILNADKNLKANGISFALSVPSQAPHMYVITIKSPPEVCSLIENKLIENESISANHHFCDNNQPIEIIQQSQQDKANENSDKNAEMAGKAVGFGVKALIELL
jgi:hypothetical protein